MSSVLYVGLFHIFVEFPVEDDSAICGAELLLLVGDGAWDETLEPSSVDVG
jgi:hypothetical protein